MKKLISSLWNGKYGELVRYVFTGGLTTLVSLVVFEGLCLFFGVDSENTDSVFVTVSNVVSIAAAIIFAYVVNKKLVFRTSCASFGRLVCEFAEFCGGRVITMLVEIGGVFLFVNIMGQYPILGKIEAEVIVVILNYIISKFIVFSKRKQVNPHIAKPERK